jgi:hypothetical protein
VEGNAPESGELNRWTTSSIVLDMAATIAEAQAFTNKTSFEGKTKGRRWKEASVAEDCSWEGFNSSSKLIEEAVAIEVEEEFNPRFDKKTVKCARK